MVLCGASYTHVTNDFSDWCNSIYSEPWSTCSNSSTVKSTLFKLILARVSVELKSRVEAFRVQDREQKRATERFRSDYRSAGGKASKLPVVTANHPFVTSTQMFNISIKKVYESAKFRRNWSIRMIKFRNVQTFFKAFV